MFKQYIVLSESKLYGWVGKIITKAKAKKILKKTKISYILSLYQNNSFIIKIRYPIKEYYDYLSINKHKEEVFEENDDYMIITYDDNDDDDCVKKCLIITTKNEIDYRRAFSCSYTNDDGVHIGFVGLKADDPKLKTSFGMI